MAVASKKTGQRQLIGALESRKQNKMGLSRDYAGTMFREQVLEPCIDGGLVEMTIQRKSRSSKRENRLTQKGKEGGSKNGGTELGVPENVTISRTSLLLTTAPQRTYAKPHFPGQGMWGFIF
jgi:hypothetical protein